MLNILTGVIAAGVIAVVIIGATIIGGMSGAFVGKILEHTFLADFIISGMAVFGVAVLPSQFPGIGAALGFVGSFFKSTLSESEK